MATDADDVVSRGCVGKKRKYMYSRLTGADIDVEVKKFKIFSG